MADFLSHSCSTCEGTGYDPHSRMANRRPCPDCYDGVYPKAAVERACDAAFEAMRREGCTFMDVTLAAIRAFHNERSEGE